MICVDYKNITRIVNVGDMILIDDGLISLKYLPLMFQLVSIDITLLNTIML